MESTIVRHVRKVDGVLDVLKGTLVGVSVEKLCVAISHAKTEKKRGSCMPKDGYQATMDRSWRDVTVSCPLVR